MLDTKQQYKLRKFLNELRQYRGRHTELVTVYIPAGYELIKIIQHLSQEQGTASNIKDKTNRLNVQDALERMIRHLRLFKATPENGLAVFSGNIASQEGKNDIRVWSLEPPAPLGIRMYRCDHTFILEPLESMMQVNEIYGLIVMDNREATLGLLKGKSIQIIRDFSSAVPGKVKVGGWCLDPETKIYNADGNIVDISELDGKTNIKSFDINNHKLINSQVLGKSFTFHSELIKIKTSAPLLEISASSNHIFFVISGNKITEKTASELKEGDCLLTPEFIDIDGEIQSFKYTGKSDKNSRLPTILTSDIARLVGYAIGDGSYDGDNRIEFAEEREDVAKYYYELAYSLFGKKPSLRYRNDKHYYELRINNRNIIRFLKAEFPEKRYCETSSVPLKIMLSKNDVVAAFLKGLFDAEGFVDKDEAAITMKNKQLVSKVHLLLLRFGIICSFCYAGRDKWSIRITDKESLVNFKNFIGFCATDKAIKLDKLIIARTYVSRTRQIVYAGSTIRELLRRFGYLKQHFKSASMFLSDKRGMSKLVFTNTFLLKLKREPQLYEELKRIVNYPLIPARITKIQNIKGEFKLVDIGVDNKNFFANGILVHNSQARYARLREDAANEFYKRISDVLNVEFASIGKDLKGILIGGPGPTKETFAHGDYIHNELKKKIIAIKDIAYTDEQGLHELVDKAQDALAEAEITKERALVAEFLTMLSTNSEKAIYGANDVMKALEYGAVDKLLLSEVFERIDEFEEKANTIGAKVFIISTETKEGNQIKELGGVCAILRYAIEN